MIRAYMLKQPAQAFPPWRRQTTPPPQRRWQAVQQPPLKAPPTTRQQPSQGAMVALMGVPPTKAPPSRLQTRDAEAQASQDEMPLEAMPQPAPVARTSRRVATPAPRAPPQAPLGRPHRRASPITTMLPLGWERIIPAEADQTPYFSDLIGGYTTRWTPPPQQHPTRVVAPTWAERRAQDGDQYWVRTGGNGRAPRTTWTRPPTRPTTAVA